MYIWTILLYHYMLHQRHNCLTWYQNTRPHLKWGVGYPTLGTHVIGCSLVKNRILLNVKRELMSRKCGCSKIISNAYFHNKYRCHRNLLHKNNCTRVVRLSWYISGPHDNQQSLIDTRHRLKTNVKVHNGILSKLSFVNKYTGKMHVD